MGKTGIGRFLIIAMVMVFLMVSCGGDNPAGDTGKKSSQKADGKKETGKKPGRAGKNRGGKKPLTMADLDKLEIPDRLKKAVKSGKVPLSRVREFLKRGQKEAPLVKLYKVDRKNLNAFLVLNGTVEPEKSVKIYSRLSAFVKRIVKEEGDRVAPGDTLAVLDDTENRISYNQAKIQLEQAKLSLAEEEKNYDRNKTLKKKELISEKDFLASESAYHQAKLEFNNRNENYKNLKLQLSYTRIEAQNNGFITERLVEVGDKVSQNQHLYTVEDFDPLLVKVFVPTSDVIKLKKGMQSEIRSDILKGTVFNGKIKLINPRIDVQSGTVKVTVEVYDESMKLKPGMFVEVKIIIGAKEDIVVIPKKTVVYKRDKVYVYIFNRGKVQQREIKLGISEGDDVEVLSGLEPGERIILVGVENVKDGQRVSVAK